MKFGLRTLFDYYPEDCAAQDYYRFLLDEVTYAEELGFDSVQMGEHHFCNYLCPSPQVFAAAHGYNIMLASVFAPIAHFAPFVQLYRDRLREAGYDPAQVEISTGNHCYVGTSSAQAKDVWAKHYLPRLLYFGEYRMNYPLAMTGCCLVNKAAQRSTACCPSWSCSWAQRINASMSAGAC